VGLIYGQVSSACLSMLRKNEGHCLTYGQGVGLSLQGAGSRVGFSIAYFLQKCKFAKGLLKAC